MSQYQPTVIIWKLLVVLEHKVLHTKLKVIELLVLKKIFKVYIYIYIYYYIWAWRLCWSCNQDRFNNFSFSLLQEAAYKIRLQLPSCFRRKVVWYCRRTSRWTDGRRLPILNAHRSLWLMWAEKGIDSSKKKRPITFRLTSIKAQPALAVLFSPLIPVRQKCADKK